jgi:hypothetical protein
MRGCPFCGKPIRVDATQCPICREAVPEVRVARHPFAAESRVRIRRGLLYLLLAAIIHYFAGGYSGFTLPVTVPPAITAYGTPALALCGLGLVVYGVYLYLRG